MEPETNNAKEIKTLIIAYETDKRFDWLIESGMPRGYGNGYVGVVRNHPWFGKGCDTINASVHGGLTWAGPLQDEDINTWWVGFDTLNCNDSIHTCPKEYVEAEVESLKQQALEAANE